MMNESAIGEAAALLIEARRSGRLLEALPERLQPADAAEATAIQMEAVRQLGETVPAYKVLGTDPETSIWGAVIGSRLLSSPARIAASTVRMLGIEGEIAFRLDADVGPAERNFTEESFGELATALATIEIIDTSYADYRGTSAIHKHADFYSNGALICGAVREDWQAADLAGVAVKLVIGGKTVVDQVGGHAAGDPRGPVIAFLNSPGRPDVLQRGTIITAGSYTGLTFAKPGDAVEVRFEGFGEVRVELTAD